jgi:hypothetical protein
MAKTNVKKVKTRRKKTQKGGYVIHNIDNQSRSRSRSRTSSASRNRNKDYKP